MENKRLYTLHRMILRAILLTLTAFFWTLSYGVEKDWDDYTRREREDFVIATAYEQSHHSKYRQDCSGFVEAVLKKMGHDVPEFTRSYDVRANGVRQIYEYVERSGRLFKKNSPSPGDLIFFSRTYDLNRDRRFNDLLTHVAIVTNVDRDGTITFIHILQKKIVTDFMNLHKPNTYEENGKILNSYLRRAQNNSSSMLTAQLFDFFGSLNP